jgi:hypothetical protein
MSTQVSAEYKCNHRKDYDKMVVRSIKWSERTMGLRVSKEATAIASDEVVTTNEATASHEAIACNEMACNDCKR